MCSLSVISGNSLTIWGTGETDPEADGRIQFQIDPERPLIIGRAEGWDVPYLDPAYRPTAIMPDGQKVLRGDKKDDRVSRGHFMVRAAAGGIVLVNGVPKRGGGIRAPLNGTWLQSPQHREMTPGEEYPISQGAAVQLWLPNGSLIQIGAI